MANGDDGAQVGRTWPDLASNMIRGPLAWVLAMSVVAVVAVYVVTPFLPGCRTALFLGPSGADCGPPVEALPAAVVVAFTEPCRTYNGWVPFDDGAGKFMLGAGSGTLRNGGPHSQGEAGTDTPLTPVRAGEQGGAEIHALEEPEMPAHRHQVGDRFAVRIGTQDGTGHARCDTLAGLGACAISHDLIHEESTPMGGSRPHNNMPPYIALYFCKKAS